MRVVDLPMLWTIVLDSAAWALIQPAIAYLALRIPARAFDPQGWLFRTRHWERGGAIYQTVFHVRAWKAWLPSGARLFAGAFEIRSLAAYTVPYLRRWSLESCRSELCHWLAILPAALFFLWNPPWVGGGMIAYAVLFNAPCIIAQRYNRPRVIRLLRTLAAPNERHGAAPIDGMPAAGHRPDES